MARALTLFTSVLTTTLFLSAGAQVQGSNMVPLGGAQVAFLCPNGAYVKLISVSGANTLYCSGSNTTDYGPYNTANNYNIDSGGAGSAQALNDGGTYYVNVQGHAATEFITATPYNRPNSVGNYTLQTSSYAGPNGGGFHNYEAAMNFYIQPDGRYKIQVIAQNGVYSTTSMPIYGGPDTGYWQVQPDDSIYTPDTTTNAAADSFQIILAPDSILQQSFAIEDSLDMLTNFYIKNSISGNYWRYTNGQYNADAPSIVTASIFEIQNSTIHPGLNGLYDVGLAQYVAISNNSSVPVGSSKQVSRQTELLVIPTGGDNYVIWTQTNPGAYLSYSSGMLLPSGTSPEVNIFEAAVMMSVSASGSSSSIIPMVTSISSSTKLSSSIALSTSLSLSDASTMRSSVSSTPSTLPASSLLPTTSADQSMSSTMSLLLASLPFTSLFSTTSAVSSSLSPLSSTSSSFSSSLSSARSRSFPSPVAIELSAATSPDSTTISSSVPSSFDMTSSIPRTSGSLALDSVSGIFTSVIETSSSIPIPLSTSRYVTDSVSNMRSTGLDSLLSTSLGFSSTVISDSTSQYILSASSSGSVGTTSTAQPASSTSTSSSSSSIEISTTPRTYINLRGEDTSNDVFAFFEQADGTIRTPYPQAYSSSNQSSYVFAVSMSGTQLTDMSGQLLAFNTSDAQGGTLIVSVPAGTSDLSGFSTNAFVYSTANNGTISVPGYKFFIDQQALLGVFPTNGVMKRQIPQTPSDSEVVLDILGANTAPICQPNGDNCLTTSLPGPVGSTQSQSSVASSVTSLSTSASKSSGSSTVTLSNTSLSPVPPTITATPQFTCSSCQTTTTFSTMSEVITTTGANGIATDLAVQTVLAVPLQYIVPCIGCATQIITANDQPITSKNNVLGTILDFVFPASQFGASETTATVFDNIDTSTFIEVIHGTQTVTIATLNPPASTVSSTAESTFFGYNATFTTSRASLVITTRLPMITSTTTVPSAASSQSAVPGTVTVLPDACSTFLSGYTCVGTSFTDTSSISASQIDTCAILCSSNAACLAFTVDPAGNCVSLTTVFTSSPGAVGVLAFSKSLLAPTFTAKPTLISVSLLHSSPSIIFETPAPIAQSAVSSSASSVSAGSDVTEASNGSQTNLSDSVADPQANSTNNNAATSGEDTGSGPTADNENNALPSTNAGATAATGSTVQTATPDAKSASGVLPVSDTFSSASLRPTSTSNAGTTFISSVLLSGSLALCLIYI